jgi:hypothetical protein
MRMFDKKNMSSFKNHFDDFCNTYKNSILDFESCDSCDQITCSHKSEVHDLCNKLCNRTHD